MVLDVYHDQFLAELDLHIPLFLVSGPGRSHSDGEGRNPSGILRVNQEVHDRPVGLQSPQSHLREQEVLSPHFKKAG